MNDLYLINNRVFQMKKNNQENSPFCGDCIPTKYSCVNFGAYLNNEELSKCYFLEFTEYKEIINSREALLYRLQGIKELKFFNKETHKNITEEILESILEHIESLQ